MRLSARLWRLVHSQHECIQQQREQIAQMRLEHARAFRDLLEGFLVAQEREIDVRDQLSDGLRDLQDEVARLEEHTWT